MSFDFRWDNPEQTVLRYAADGDWNWNDLHKHMRRSTLWFDPLDHPVETIIDLRGGARMPGGAVGQLRSLGKKLHRNSRARTIIMGVDAELQHQLGAVAGVYQTPDQLIRFAATDAEAAAILAEWAAELAVNTPQIDRDDPRYRRAARLLAQKLGVEWRDLPVEQVLEYLRKIEIAREKQPHPPAPSPLHGEGESPNLLE